MEGRLDEVDQEAFFITATPMSPTRYSAPRTLHPASYTLHPAPCTLRPTSQPLEVG